MLGDHQDVNLGCKLSFTFTLYKVSPTDNQHKNYSFGMTLTHGQNYHVMVVNKRKVSL